MTEQGSERLDDDQVRVRAMEWWPTVKEWVADASKPCVPPAGSALAEDDEQTQQLMASSHLARVSLVMGTDHLLTALGYSFNFGPSLFSMQTLLRTAMIGGAQAVWLLSPDDRSIRVDRTTQLARDAYWNQAMWANTITLEDPGVDPTELTTVRQTLRELVPGKRGAEVKLGTVIRAAAEYVYASPPDPEIWAECLAEFRHLSSAAHALPWNISTRAEKQATELDGHAGTLYLPSWTQLQGALSFSHAFLEVGWRLFHERRSPTTE
ncbi:MAG TPA: hypothetical protein VFT70_12080 [Nocardioides sp.]|nr:hypothetical protein [Nocardioides sp.]